MNVNRAYTDFTHIIRLKDGTTTRKSVSMSGYSIDFVTSDIASALYAATPNANSDALTLECETYYDGVQVRNTTSRSITALVKDSDPTFAGNFSFLDINSTTVGVTGNNQVLIQSHSKLRVQVTAANRALPVNGATIKEYVATMSGSSKSTGWSSSGTVTMDIGEINSPVSANISVTAIDSRGNKTTKVKRVEVIPYSSPSMSITAKRNNNFDEASTLRVTGNFSPLTVGGVNKNNVSTVYFEIRLKGTTSLIAGGGWSASNSGTSYDSGSQARSFDSDKAYDITLRVQDRIGSSSQVVTISPGKPILYLDPARNSVGVGRYPTMNDRFEVGRQMFGEKGMDLTESLNVGGELDVTGRGTMRGASILGSAKFSDDVELGYNRNWIDAAKSGIDAANSTIHNVDDFLFRSSTVRGLGFLKSGKSLNSQNESDYDFLKIKDGKGFLNGVPAFVSDSEILWNGGLMMGGSHSATPSKKMSECPNGWILVWSEYNSGIIDSLWNYFFLPKSRAGLSGGMTLVLGHKSRTHHYKYLDDITDTTIYGHSVNTQSPQNVSVLRYVLSF